MPGYSLNLHGPVSGSGTTENMDTRLDKWRRSIRRVGGFWSGTANYACDSISDAKDFYLTSIMRRLTEGVGGLVTWEGCIGEMALTLNGVTYTRTMTELANAFRATYTRIGANLLTNGDVETAAWAAEGKPPTCERTTDWVVEGTYGMHCITSSSANDEGMEIENGVEIETEVGYRCTVAVDNIQGVWVLKIKDNDTDVTIGKYKLAALGNTVMQAEVTEDNTSASAVRIILIEKTTGTAGEIYADNARLCISPTRAETTWYTDATSITDFGRKEEILLEGQMTDAAALSKCRKELARRAWPRSMPPEQMVSETIQDARGRREGLYLTFLGFVHTLNWRYLQTTTGEAQCNTHVTSLVGESDYISAGAVAENTVTYLVSPDYPTRLWDVLEDIILSGSGTTRFEGGVYAGRQFNYQPVSSSLAYHYSGGQLLAVNRAPEDPWLARPGLARIDDMPVGPGEISGNIADDPRNVYLDEIEFIAPGTLAFRRETRTGR